MRQLLYIIGQPGAGKTTALARALAGVPRQYMPDGRPPFTLYPHSNGAQLGVERAGFAGTDGFALNVQPTAVAWLRDSVFDLVVSEGDRLANDGFYSAAMAYGYDLTIAWIDTPNDVAAQRRKARGSNQNPTWLKGRISKVESIAHRWHSHVIRIDGRLDPYSVAGQLAELPAITAIRRAAGLPDTPTPRVEPLVALAQTN